VLLYRGVISSEAPILEELRLSTCAISANFLSQGTPRLRTLVLDSCPNVPWQWQVLQSKALENLTIVASIESLELMEARKSSKNGSNIARSMLLAFDTWSSWIVTSHIQANRSKSGC